MKTPVKPTKEGISLNVYVQPGASRAAWAGQHDDAFKLKVTARPVDGQANIAVIAFIAQFFAVPKAAVTIAHGLSARHKTILVVGQADRLLARAAQIGAV